MNIFKRKVVDTTEGEKTKKEAEETKRVIEVQREVSDDTLDFVQQVLDDKDRLLAEALNQTGAGLRRRRVVTSKAKSG